MSDNPFIRPLTAQLEERLNRNHSLNVDTFIIPSPYVRDERLEKDYAHSYVWEEEGELLGYLLLYASPDRTRYHIYKQVTSPFGRGKGIGSAFIERLVAELEDTALLYLIIWEKQQEAILFFANKGFVTADRLVYRGLTFLYMEAQVGTVRSALRGEVVKPTMAEELGKTRHDARKMLKLLSDMVDKMNSANCNRIIEDVNRETTALINMLNAYRDAMEYRHDVDVKTLIIERILPFIEGSPVRCEVRLVVKGPVGQAYGHYLDIGRALVNLASNALDAIREARRPGRITIALAEEPDAIVLSFKDNGVGIEAERLRIGPDGVPLFVGKTTKLGPEGTADGPSPVGSGSDTPGDSAAAASPDNRTPARPEAADSSGGTGVGQGIGTRQIFAAFGAEKIRVTSTRGRGTTWVIRLAKRPHGDRRVLDALEARHREAMELLEQGVPEAPDAAAKARPFGRDEVAAYIWRLRKVEVYKWDLILQFAKHHNIREIYRMALAYRHDQIDAADLERELLQCRIDYPALRGRLLEILNAVRRADRVIESTAPINEYGGVLLKSYGQATDRTVIFTIDPENGRFIATDRKLAEHVDFAHYLGRDRDHLLRGELSGDLNNAERPITLGVWSVRNRADALRKIALIRAGARRLVTSGLKRAKRLTFYQTTYVESPEDINTYLTTTLGDLADTPDDRLERFLVGTDDEIPPFMITD